jgi:hypothetical protein
MEFVFFFYERNGVPKSDVLTSEFPEANPESGSDYLVFITNIFLLHTPQLKTTGLDSRGIWVQLPAGAVDCTILHSAQIYPASCSLGAHGGKAAGA